MNVLVTRPSDTHRRGTSPRPFQLRDDVRIHLFACIFALGAILHELEFMLEQALAGPLGDYMERWNRVLPSLSWPSELGVTLHMANVAISLLLLVLPWRRELLCLLAIPFLLSQLASPDRISSHSMVMTAGLLVILILGIAEWLERVVGRRPPPGAASPPEERNRSGSSRTDWYGWTLTGLAGVCALAYFFAFFYKLNPTWLSSDSAGPAFLIEPLSPILDRAGAPPVYRSLLAGIAIYGTLLIELALPVLLFLRPTRLLGCFLGLAFHLPMIARGVADFSAVTLAFYAAFLTLAQARELLRRLARPSLGRLAGTAVLGVFGVWAVQRTPKLIWLRENAADPNALVRVGNLVLTCGLFLLALYAALTLGAWLLQRSAAPEEPPAGRFGSPQPSRGSALAAAVVLFIGSAFVYNNLAQFFGAPAVGPMIMYSGINLDRTNHLLMPRVPLADSHTYVSLLDFDAEMIETREAREFGVFAEWLGTQDEPHVINLNFLRYHMSRICGSTSGPVVRLEIEEPGGDVLSFPNVCTEPTMLRYVPLPIALPCNPQCDPVIRRWARGRLLDARLGREISSRRSIR